MSAAEILIVTPRPTSITPATALQPCVLSTFLRFLVLNAALRREQFFAVAELQPPRRHRPHSRSGAGRRLRRRVPLLLDVEARSDDSKRAPAMTTDRRARARHSGRPRTPNTRMIDLASPCLSDGVGSMRG